MHHFTFSFRNYITPAWMPYSALWKKQNQKKTKTKAKQTSEIIPNEGTVLRFKADFDTSEPLYVKSPPVFCTNEATVEYCASSLEVFKARLRAAWSSWKRPCSLQGSLASWPSKVFSSPNYSLINLLDDNKNPWYQSLWICCSTWRSWCHETVIME